MRWVITGNSSRFDGILYVIDAETEEEAYAKLATLREMKYLRVEKNSTPRSVAGGKQEGLDDTDEFSDDQPYDIIIHEKAEIPSWELLDMADDFRGWIVYATPLELNMNLNDIIQW